LLYANIPAVIRDTLRRWFFGAPQTTFIGGGGRLPYVTASSALQYSPVYRAVTLIATDVARLELEISSPEANQLMRNPSPYMTAFDFRRAMTMNVLLFGNAFAIINRTGMGEMAELIMLDPIGVSLDIRDGVPMYRTNGYGMVPADSMFHLRAPSPNGLWGDSPVEICRGSIQLIAAQEGMAASAYANGGNPKIAIVHPGRISPEAMQKIESDYQKYHAGAENSGRPFVAIEGVKIERLSSTLDDTGLAAARNYSVEDVSRIFGVPAHMLGQATGGNAYGSLEWLGRVYTDSCLSGWLACWSAEIVAKLALPGATAVFDTDELAKPSMAELFAALRTGVESGVITRNEAREELDLSPLPGLDEPIVAKNMGLGGGSTNIGSDTSANTGTPNDF